MNSILDPILGILAIVVPLGFAYVILSMQSKTPVIPRDELLQERAELSRTGGSQFAR